MNIHDLVTEHFGISDELYSLSCEHLGKNSVVASFHDNYLPRLADRRWAHSLVHAHRAVF